jgi:hypothetical protein
MTIELDSTLAQAEVLFLSFAQIVADIDRRKAEEGLSTAWSSNGLRHRGALNAPLSAEDRSAQTLSRIQLSDDLRALLKTGH